MSKKQDRAVAAARVLWPGADWQPSPTKQAPNNKLSTAPNVTTNTHTKPGWRYAVVRPPIGRAMAPRCTTLEWYLLVKGTN